MKNNLFTWSVITCVLMIGMPWCAVSFAGDMGMGICFILFFALNPLFSVISGIFAGMRFKKMWPMPIVVSGLFILGTWMFFELGEPAFIMYAGVYLLLGIIAMLLTFFIKRYRERCLRDRSF